MPVFQLGSGRTEPENGEVSVVVQLLSYRITRLGEYKPKHSSHMLGLIQLQKPQAEIGNLVY